MIKKIQSNNGFTYGIVVLNLLIFINVMVRSSYDDFLRLISLIGILLNAIFLFRLRSSTKTGESNISEREEGKKYVNNRYAVIAIIGYVILLFVLNDYPIFSTGKKIILALIFILTLILAFSHLYSIKNKEIKEYGFTQIFALISTAVYFSIIVFTLVIERNNSISDHLPINAITIFFISLLFLLLILFENEGLSKVRTTIKIALFGLFVFFIILLQVLKIHLYPEPFIKYAFEEFEWNNNKVYLQLARYLTNENGKKMMIKRIEGEITRYENALVNYKKNNFIVLSSNKYYISEDLINLDSSSRNVLSSLFSEINTQVDFYKEIYADFKNDSISSNQLSPNNTTNNYEPLDQFDTLGVLRQLEICLQNNEEEKFLYYFTKNEIKSIFDGPLGLPLMLTAVSGDHSKEVYKEILSNNNFRTEFLNKDFFTVKGKDGRFINETLPLNQSYANGLVFISALKKYYRSEITELLFENGLTYNKSASKVVYDYINLNNRDRRKVAIFNKYIKNNIR